MNLKNSGVDNIETDVILSSNFENFVIISLNKFDEVKYSVSNNFLEYLRDKVEIYDYIGKKKT